MGRKKGGKGRKIREHVVGDQYDEDELRRYVPKKIFKTDAQRRIIKDSLASHFLFAGLQFAQIDSIVDAMTKEDAKNDQNIVQQGDDGDKFYVIESGKFDIYVNNVFAVQYHAGQNFGELALMYNCPRAATVKANGKGTLFALDRMGFHRFMKDATQEVEHDIAEFLKSVKLLSGLTKMDVEKLVESFTRTKFQDGEVIIKQGQEGEIFYIVEEGSVDCVKDGEKVMNLTRGEFFGERALIENKPRQATCMARGAVSCLALLRTEFEMVIGKKLKGDLEDTHTQRLAIEVDVKRAPQRKLLKCKLSDFQFQTIIGKGAFGMVKLVKHKPTKTPMAMKQMQKARIVMTKQCKNVIQEKRIMHELNHPFLLKLIATVRDQHCLYLITEFLQGGDIFAKLCDCDGIFSVATTRYYIACVTEAFHYIHDLKIVYRDLKPENLVLTEKGVLKVVDFGMAKHVAHITFTVCGTPEYMAPEIIHGKGHNKAVDYWALGILVYEMIIGHTPFADASNNHLKIYKKIDKHCSYSARNGRKKSTIEFPKWIQKEPYVVDIVLKFLIAKPIMRLGCLKGGAEVIRRHQWFKSARFNWKHLLNGQMKPPIIPKVSDKWDACHFDEWGPDSKDITPYVNQGQAYEKLWEDEF